LPSYLMKAKCDVPDEIFKKIEEGFWVFDEVYILFI
jgi:hypothetical protein